MTAYLRIRVDVRFTSDRVDAIRHGHSGHDVAPLAVLFLRAHASALASAS